MELKEGEQKISANVMEAAGISPKLDLVRIPVACVGYFGVTLNMTISGEVTLNLVENISIGLYYENGGFYMKKDFSKESFTLQAKIEISAGLTATLGMTSCNILKGELYAKFGAKNVLDSLTYDDGKKLAMCAHHNAWFFASAGGFAEMKLFTQRKSWGQTYQIYTEKNSPIRVSFHYEDGITVPRCTRGTAYGPTGRKRGIIHPPICVMDITGRVRGLARTESRTQFLRIVWTVRAEPPLPAIMGMCPL